VKIIIEREKCQGHGRCAALAEGVYSLDEEGYIETQSGDVPPDREREAYEGARGCPERVIVIEKNLMNEDPPDVLPMVSASCDPYDGAALGQTPPTGSDEMD